MLVGHVLQHQSSCDDHSRVCSRQTRTAHACQVESARGDAPRSSNARGHSLGIVKNIRKKEMNVCVFRRVDRVCTTKACANFRHCALHSQSDVIESCRRSSGWCAFLSPAWRMTLIKWEKKVKNRERERKKNKRFAIRCIKNPC